MSNFTAIAALIENTALENTTQEGLQGREIITFNKEQRDDKYSRT